MLVSMLIYFGSLFYLLIENRFGVLGVTIEHVNVLYNINVILCLSFCAVLGLSYTSFTRKMNTELSISNRFLSEEKDQLIKEMQDRVQQLQREEKLKKEIARFKSVTHGIIKRKLKLMLHLLESGHGVTMLEEQGRQLRRKALMYIDESISDAKEQECIHIPGYLGMIKQIFEPTLKIETAVKGSKDVNSLVGFSLSIILFELMNCFNDLQLVTKSEVKVNYAYQEDFHFFKIIISPAIDLKIVCESNVDSMKLINTYVSQLNAGFTIAGDTIQITVADGLVR
jgi:hypothetical protein